MTKQQPEIAWRYVGPDWFPGIPRRDLTQAEYDALPILAQHDVRDSSAYEEGNPPAKLDAPKTADVPAKTGGKENA